MASMQETKKSNRGFASIDPEKQRLIAQKVVRASPMKSAASRKTRSWPQARAAKAVRPSIPVNAVFLAITRLLQRPVGKAAMPLIALPSRDQLPRTKGALYDRLQPECGNPQWRSRPRYEFHAETFHSRTTCAESEKRSRRQLSQNLVRRLFHAAFKCGPRKNRVERKLRRSGAPANFIEHLADRVEPAFKISSWISRGITLNPA